MYQENCSFCNPKKKDWEEENFYGFRCKECQGPTAFVVSSDHKGKISDKEKETVTELCKKHYPDLEIKWISAKRNNMSHWYDFLLPIKEE